MQELTKADHEQTCVPLHVTKAMLNNKSIVAVSEAEDPAIVWQEEYVAVTDRWMVAPSSYFLMWVGRKENPKATYVRPIEKHLSALFEDLFDFGCACDGFTTERVVRIE
jgi:hypothetical protein